MRALGFASLLLGLSIAISRDRATAQQDFGQVLLQAFTTGTLPGAGGSMPSSTPLQSLEGNKPESFPSVTLEPMPQASLEELSELEGTPDSESNDLLDAASESLGSSPSSSPTPVDASTIDENTDPGNGEEIVFQIQSLSTPLPSLAPSLTPSPSTSPLPSLPAGKEETESSSTEISSPSITPASQPTTSEHGDPPMVNATPDPEIGDSLIQSLETPRNSTGSMSGIFTAIKVNCGGMKERSTINEDKTKWYNVDSQIAEDPYAAAHFVSDIDAILYSSYRYATTQLTYKVDLPEPGRWQVVLQWAEISQFYMKEGARVFSVLLNSIETENEIDVYRDSPQGKFSPLIRTYEVDAPDPTLLIEIHKIVGQPMLSAFQVAFIGPSSP